MLTDGTRAAWLLICPGKMLSAGSMLLRHLSKVSLTSLQNSTVLTIVIGVENGSFFRETSDVCVCLDISDHYDPGYRIRPCRTHNIPYQLHPNLQHHWTHASQKVSPKKKFASSNTSHPSPCTFSFLHKNYI